MVAGYTFQRSQCFQWDTNFALDDWWHETLGFWALIDNERIMGDNINVLYQAVGTRYPGYPINMQPRVITSHHKPPWSQGNNIKRKEWKYMEKTLDTFIKRVFLEGWWRFWRWILSFRRISTKKMQKKDISFTMTRYMVSIIIEVPYLLLKLLSTGNVKNFLIALNGRNVSNKCVSEFMTSGKRNFIRLIQLNCCIRL